MTGAALLRRIGRLALPGLFLAASCVSPRAPERREPAVRALPRAEGTTVTGRLEPGEQALYSIPLEAGEYLEVHLDRPPEELRVQLFAHAVGSETERGELYSFGERAPDTAGQVMWAVMTGSGLHDIRLEPLGASPVPFQLEIRALRTATQKDWSAHRGAEVWNQARALSEAGRLREALELFDQALELCREGGYVRGMASTYSSRGRILHSLGRLEDAREDLAAALEIWTRLGEEGSMAGAHIGLSGVEREVAHWEEMNEHLDKALEIARRLRYFQIEAHALTQSCKAHMDLGRTDQALEACRRALQLLEQAGRSPYSVDALINLGYIHYYKGELDQARGYYSRALDLLERRPDPVQEATLRNNLALLHDAAGEYQVALASFQQALNAYDDLERTGFSAKVLLNMGRIHQRLRDPSTARDFFSQALTRMMEADDLLGRIGVLHALGDLQVEEEEWPDARRILDEALALSRRAGSLPLLAASLSRIGLLHLEENRAEAALGPLEEALELYRASAHRWGEAQVLADLAEASAQLGDEERALDLLFEATNLNEAIGNRAGLAQSHYRIARIERDRGNLEAARSAIEQAEAVLDAVRLLVGTEDLRALFSATTRPYHELHVEVLMAQHRQRPEGGHDAEALRESERARARSLLEILTEEELDPGSDVPQELLSRRAELQDRLNEKGLERQNVLGTEDADPAALFRVKLDIEALLNQLREVEREIQSASPRYAALTLPQPVTVGEIQRSLLDGETALLEYSLGEERSFLWVVSDDGLRTHELAGRAEIEAVARCFQWLVTAYGETPVPEALAPEEAVCLRERLPSYGRSRPGESGFSLRHRRRGEIAQVFEQTASELSRLVLAPAADRPLPYRLAVVTDGALEYVPFAALPEPGVSGRPLVMTHELARLPSASVLALQRTQPASAAPAKGELAIVADPLYSRDDERVTVADSASGSEAEASPETAERGPTPRFSRLDFSGREAQAIARFAGPGGAYLAQGPDATRETVLGGALAGYRYVHFGTHAVVDTQYPQFSRLVLSLVDSQGRPREDGFLRLHDIYGLELDDTDMVVLSACDTALGREIRGEGLVGLTRGFLYAGAERVVASLWQVQDLATASLMEHFYRSILKEGLSPAEALREAQLTILEDPAGRHAFPYYWAGFVLQGEWR